MKRRAFMLAALVLFIVGSVTQDLWFVVTAVFLYLYSDITAVADRLDRALDRRDDA